MSEIVLVWILIEHFNDESFFLWHMPDDATFSVASYGVCHKNKVNSITWLCRDDLAMR